MTGEEARTEIEAEPGPAETPSQAAPVDRDTLAALLERHNLPRLRSFEPLQGGEVNAMLLVNGDMVARFNRRDPHLPKLSKEALIYRRLRRSTDVPCPEVLALDTTRELLPYDVLILSYVEGLSGRVVWDTLDEDAREKLSEEIGRMFGAIHNLQWSAYGDYDPETVVLGQHGRWADMLLQRLERAAAEAIARDALPQRLIDGVLTEINDGDSVLETASLPALVHGDLHAGNFLLKQQDADWHVTAILDWEWAFTADAAWEFAALDFRRSDADPVGDAFLYGYRERHPVQSDLRSRVHLYRLMLHLEGAVIAQRHFASDPNLRRRHEYVLRRLLRRK